MKGKRELIAFRIPKKDLKTIDTVIANDIQWDNRSQVIRSIVRYWCEEQRAQEEEA